MDQTETAAMVLRLLRPGENVEDASWLHLTDGEKVRWTGRPSRFTIAISMVGGFVLALLGVALSVWLVHVASFVDPSWLGYVPLVLTVVGLGRAGLVYLDWLRLLYVITDEEIYVKHGLVSRDVTQVRLDRVQNTAFEQSVFERLLGYGDVRIYTAGTSTEDLTFRNVPNPDGVKNALTELLSDHAGTNDGHRTATR